MSKNLINNWTKTALTTISDSYLFLVSQVTGETKPISWASIKSLLETHFNGFAFVFTQKIKAPNGTATTEVVNFQQLDTKLNKSGGTMTGTLTLYNGTSLNIPEFSGTFPTTRTDPQGHDGDIIRSGKRIAMKTTSDGWCYIDFIRLP